MRILSVDGGGYLGLATASFLQTIEEHFGGRAADRFDLFCGTSTGAIIALGLASGMAGREVAELYQELGPKVFPPARFLGRRFPRLRMALKARYDNAPLTAALERAFGARTLGDLRARGKRILVTAFSLSSGTPKIFKTDHAQELTAHDRYLIRDVALASAAAPTYLPIVQLADPSTGVMERFCDGGLVSNSPALLGYAEAVSHLRQRPEALSILSLATPRADLAERSSALSAAQRQPARGYLRWGFGERLITIAMDGHAMVADQALKRIAASSGARYERVAFEQPLGVGFDIVTTEATDTLCQLGTERAREARVRDALAPFFCNEV